MAGKRKVEREREQLPLPSKPYERGKAKPLILCDECKCWMPVQHNCRPIE